MFPVFANRLADATAPVPSAEDLAILGSFLAAALFFAVVATVRALTKKREQPPALPMSPEDAALYAPGVAAEPPAPLPPPQPTAEAAGDLYAPPQAAPDPEPAPAPFVPEGTGIFRYFRVSTAIYRKIDLIFIGLVFLIFAGLTTASGGEGGHSEVPVEQKFQPEALVVSIFFQFLLMGMACAFVVRRIGQAEWLGLRWRKWWLSFLIAPVAVFCMWCLMGFLQVTGWNGWLERVFHIESLQESVKVLKEAKDPVVVVLMAVAAVFVAPMAEEVVFRGYLYPAAKRFCGPLGGMIFSSLVFASAHGNVVALLPLFILAMLLCLVYEFTGSIWANISVHFLFNAATVAIQLLVRYGIVPTDSP